MWPQLLLLMLKNKDISCLYLNHQVNILGYDVTIKRYDELKLTSFRLKPVCKIRSHQIKHIYKNKIQYILNFHSPT